jgi:hypothetical protein
MTYKEIVNPITTTGNVCPSFRQTSTFRETIKNAFSHKNGLDYELNFNHREDTWRTQLWCQRELNTPLPSPLLENRPPAPLLLKFL